MLLLKKRFKFPKEEKLCSKKGIEELFSKGEHFHIYPYKVFFLKKGIDVKSKKDTKIKVLLAVPKKRIRRAVHRNLLKRRMRESYRLQKYSLMWHCNQESSNMVLRLGIIYVADKRLPFSVLDIAMKQIVKQLNEKL